MVQQLSIRLFFFIVSFSLTGKLMAQSQWVYLKADSTEIQRFQQLLEKDTKVYGYSQWEHAFGVEGNVHHYPFIQTIVPMASYKKSVSSFADESLAYGRGDWQLKMLGLDSFHKLGFTGKGVTIALMDGGFYKVDSLAAFDSLWKRNQIKGYYDFVDNDSVLFDADSHGMSVLSIIGGNIPDSMIGAAPDANFLLYRTEEVSHETHKEEFSWIKGMEEAHRMGADIIHSSLGYSVFDTLEGDYTYFDMDGKSTFITRATDSAFYKGIFVTNSAGNEGEKPWRHITAPCDGKFVLCVGAVDSMEQKAKFSSFGPSADGRVKPEVMAMGQSTTIVGSDGLVRTGSGTSFSGPVMAGFVACLKQAHPKVENYRLYLAIIRSADRFNNPDSAYGYGIPNILRADSILKLMASLDNMAPPSQVKIYPNPGKENLTLQGEQNIEAVDITNMDGRSLYVDAALNPSPAKEINTSNFPSGVYFIHVKCGQEIYRLKWIKID